MFRNYRNADGEEITAALMSLPSNDGKQAPMKLDPGVQTYFRFASVKTASNIAVIVILPGITHEKWLRQEAGVKLGISGADLPHHRIDLRLTLQEDKTLAIASWKFGEKAVDLSDRGD